MAEQERSMFARFTLTVAALLGAVAVALGAFAAHGLRGRLSEPLLQVFQTGVHYQFYHVLALLLVGLLLQRRESRGLRLAAMLFLLGILIFCGSLYLLALSGVHWLGAITPLGGSAFIAGWLVLAFSIVQHGKHNADSGER
jgi:uncharacterized membrane protein YgdD (TMEM256/DUF423 family)